jgi:hypothetical protein
MERGPIADVSQSSSAPDLAEGLDHAGRDHAGHAGVGLSRPVSPLRGSAQFQIDSPVAASTGGQRKNFSMMGMGTESPMGRPLEADSPLLSSHQQRDVWLSASGSGQDFMISTDSPRSQLQLGDSQSGTPVPSSIGLGPGGGACAGSSILTGHGGGSAAAASSAAGTSSSPVGASGSAGSAVPGVSAMLMAQLQQQQRLAAQQQLLAQLQLQQQLMTRQPGTQSQPLPDASGAGVAGSGGNSGGGGGGSSSGGGRTRPVRDSALRARAKRQQLARMELAGEAGSGDEADHRYLAAATAMAGGHGGGAGAAAGAGAAGGSADVDAAEPSPRLRQSARQNGRAAAGHALAHGHGHGHGAGAGAGAGAGPGSGGAVPMDISGSGGLLAAATPVDEFGQPLEGAEVIIVSPSPCCLWPFLTAGAWFCL